MTTNPIQATSRTFARIKDDINSRPELVDKPDWWKDYWAGVGDMASVMLNSQANNGFLRPATVRQAGQDLLQLIDYQLRAILTSSGSLLFDVDRSLGTGIFPFVVSASQLNATTQGSTDSSSKRFEARAQETFSLVEDNFTANATTDELTVSFDFQFTGWIVRAATTVTLPAGLSTGVDYFVIFISTTIVKLATSRANALAGNAIDLTDTGTGTHKLQLYSKEVNGFQQELKEDVNIGTADGITQFLELLLPDQSIIHETLNELEINSITWTKVTTQVESTSISKHFKIIVKSEDQTAIQFGDGTFGEIPPAFDVFADYAIGGGSSSVVNLINSVNSYTGGNAKLVGVMNATTMTGGDNEENLESAKIIGPLLLKGQNRFVLTSDGEALAINTGGLSQVRVNKNKFGVLSCQVIGIALGGGNPSAAVKAELEIDLIDLTVLESIDVRVQDTTITSTDVTAQAQILPGFSFATVKPFIDLAFELQLTETGKEIKTDFDSNGFASALLKINTILEHTFTSQDESNIRPLLENLAFVKIASTLNASDVLGYIDTSVVGLDFIEVTVFGASGFPLVNADNEITTPGTILVTELP